MAIRRQRLGIFCLALLSAITAAPAFAEVKLPVPAIDQSAVAKRGFFYVGGKYVGEPDKHILQGQTYVEVLAPKVQRRPYPLVLIHGAAQTATNWMGTPDGRPGWADFFVGQGYTVYMIDQPARGRSAWQPDIDGKLTAFAAERIEQLFTAPETLGNWPQAKKHTQWPGSGRIGDPVFDAFYATQVQYLADVVPTERVPPDARSFRLRSPAW